MPLTLQDEINGRDFILGLDGIVGNMVNGDDELGHGGPSWYERDDGLPNITCARMVPGEAGGVFVWGHSRVTSKGKKRP